MIAIRKVIIWIASLSASDAVELYRVGVVREGRNIPVSRAPIPIGSETVHGYLCKVTCAYILNIQSGST